MVTSRGVQTGPCLHTNIQDTLWVSERGDNHLQGPEREEMKLEMRAQGIHE